MPRSERPLPAERTIEVSVVIPTRDRPARLAACLSALARQDLGSAAFQALVVDDGGNDPAEPHVRPFRDAIDVTVIRQPQAGPAAARNRGARHALGRLLAFTDDDCAPAADWLARLLARSRTFEGALIGGRVINALHDNPYSALSQFIVDEAYAHHNPDPENARFFASNNMCVPADRFREVGGFDPRFRTAEDRDLCARWALGGHRLIYAPDAVVFHAHDLSLGKLWRQHYHYGRGAFQYHSARRAELPDRRWLEWSFYGRLAYRWVKAEDRPDRNIGRAALLAVQQAANAAGFFAALAEQGLASLARRRR